MKYIYSFIVSCLILISNLDAQRVENLSWDPGSAHEGTQVLSASNQNGERIFRINTQNSLFGGWRTILRVTSGEANIAIERDQIPTLAENFLSSENAGDDGWVINARDFSAGQTWFIKVISSGNASWELVSGEVFVENLSSLNFTDSNSNGVYDLDEEALPSGSGDVEIGPEGNRYFQVSIPTGTPAWALYLNGQEKDISVRQGGIPFTEGFEQFNKQGEGALLVVPPFLGSGNDAYFVSVSGESGDIVNLDSRIHEVEQIGYEDTRSNVQVSGFPYKTYVLTAPSDAFAWTAILESLAGDAQLALREGEVASEISNTAYSENSVPEIDSITLVSPTLKQGAWYVTVYSETDFDFNLTLQPEAIPVVSFVGQNSVLPTNRGAWNYFAVNDISSQLDVLGWELKLDSLPEGAKLAIRRNDAPSIWNQRTSADRPTGTNRVIDEHDFITESDLLQRPRHEADVWYIGVYLPVTSETDPEPIVLSRNIFTPELLAVDGAEVEAVGHKPRTWKFFQVDVPAGILGWDVRLNNSAGKRLELAVSRSVLPESVLTSGFTGQVANSFDWPAGATRAGRIDWSGRRNDFDGNSILNQRLLNAFGRPLEAGTYYVGVFNSSESETYNYSIDSALIGESGSGRSNEVTDLNYSQGAEDITDLPVRDIVYYKVDVPAGEKLWQLKLSDSIGRSVYAVRKDFLPDFDASQNGNAQSSGGISLVKPEGEGIISILPEDGETEISPGEYYIGVLSEGMNASSTNLIGEGNASSTLVSDDDVNVIDFGSVDSAILEETITLVPGVPQFLTASAVDSLPAIEFSLIQDTNNAVLTVEKGPLFPRPSQFTAISGGERADLTIRTVGTLTSVNGEQISMSLTTNREITITVRITPRRPVDLDFQGGESSVTQQGSETWRYFEVVVPEGVLGWDVKLENISGGDPQLVVSRETIPINVGTNFNTDGVEWPEGKTWTATADWSLQSVAERYTNTRLISAMGRPLEPGKYIVGVFNDKVLGDEETQYDIVSGSIGSSGSGADYEVEDLSFDGGSGSEVALIARDVAYYKVTIPESTLSWRVRLKQNSGESLMVVRSGFIPDFIASERGDVSRRGGVVMDQEGNEWYHLLPSRNEQNIPAGDYFITVFTNPTEVSGTPPEVVISETVNASHAMESLGEIPIIPIGEASTSLIEQEIISESGELEYYQFTVPEGLTNLRVSIVSVDGSCFGFSFEDTIELLSPAPRVNQYGFDGGVVGDEAFPTTSKSVGFINPTPTPGAYTVVTRGFPGGRAFLRVQANGIGALEFNGGVDTIVGHSPQTWVYYNVEVPDNPDFLGWDLELTDEQGGSPTIVVRKGALPSANTTSGWVGVPSANTEWPELASWGQIGDFTGKVRDPNSFDSRNGDRFISAFGKPLTPGSYVVGVFNRDRFDAASYVIRSKAIGSGDALVQVTDAADLSAPVVVEDLQARQSLFVKFTIPENLPRYSLRLGNIGGETNMSLRQSYIPDTTSQERGDIDNLGGIRVSRDGNEYYTMLPAIGESTIEPGVYFAAITSLGNNPTATAVGQGDSFAEFEKLPEIPITELGSLVPIVSEDQFALDGGQLAFYSFTVTPGTEVAEVRLVDVIGNPAFSLLKSDQLPAPRQFTYGNDGGLPATLGGDSILTLPNPEPGDYKLTIHAGDVGQQPFPASAKIAVRALSVQDLAFSVDASSVLSNRDSGALQDEQIKVYRVSVPTDLPNRSDIIGWKISLETTSGDGEVRVYGSLEERQRAIISSQGVAALVPPFYEEGSEYIVDVTAIGSTIYTITSEPIFLELSPWVMPIGPNQDFGDSGKGLADDGGRNLDQDDWHFYAVDIPESNAGVLRTIVEAINGDPAVYIRTGEAPTTTHSINGFNGRVFDRQILRSETRYASWVPLDGRVENELEAGLWYIGIHAESGGNARYRLQVSSGNVTNLNLEQLAANESVFATDWKYYKLELPFDLPDYIDVNLNVTFGDAVLYVRDSLPPGLGVSEIRDLNNLANAINDADDRKNQGPYELLGWRFQEPLRINSPPLRAGETYYFGVYGLLDSQYSIVVNSGPSSLPPLEEVAFNGGERGRDLAPNESDLFYFNVPLGAESIRAFTVKEEGLQVSIEQGALPLEDGVAHYRRPPRRNELVNVILRGYPFLSAETYFVRIKNTTEESQPYTFTFESRNDDGDVLPDGWELANFGNLDQLPGGDFNNDGISNFYSYALSIDPITGEFLNGALPPAFVWNIPDQRGALEFSLPNPRSDIRYSIQRNNDLLPGSWREINSRTGISDWVRISNVEITESGRTEISDLPDNDFAEKSFYRIEVRSTR